jgi:aldose 1-epimerase
MNVQTATFGKLSDGREAKLYTFTNSNGLSIKITNYGGIITCIEMPDKDGKNENVVCGFNDLESYLSEEYLANYPYFGAIIGRFGNRIARGNLEIGGKSYPLAINNGPNHLHGGVTGFDKRLWNAAVIEKEDAAGISLTYHSPHLEEKYPGNLDVICMYMLNNKNELIIEYTATTDELTVVNLTNHTYFNLTGGRKNILDHELKLASVKMTEMSDQIPTGSIVSTADTPYDFSEFKKIMRDMKDIPGGYDDNYVLDNENGALIYAGTLREPESGRQVEVYTTQPGMQLYTGYWIPELVINGEKKFGRFSGVALETQHYPDSVHHPNFPSTLLQPGETYNEKTIYKFITG